MDKDTITISIVSVLITIAVIGGVYYMAVVRQPDPNQSTTWQTLNPNADQPIGGTGNPSVSAETSTRRTNTPIKCHDPEIGEFWTNAATCEGADLQNRLSIAEPLRISPQRPDFENKKYVQPGENTDRSRTTSGTSRQKSAKKPNLRLAAKSPPSGLSPECRFPVGKALEIERALSAADDPRESIWRENYCEWLLEVREERCEVSWELFYYRNICPRR